MNKISFEDRQLFDALHDARVKANEVFNQRAFRGVKPNVVDKYAETAHFVYELLQNADDANATDVTIILMNDRLLFKHNGTKHFDITSDDEEPVGDINSITGIGNSSKENTQNKIGKFGVGFKAVFQYTDTPEIYDDAFKFKIEDLIVPTLIEHDYPDRESGETLFVLPFRNPQKSFTEIRSRLESLKNPILFLRHLKRIVWGIEGNANKNYPFKVYSKSLIDKQKYRDITLEKYRLINASREDYIFLFSKNVSIPTNDGEKHLFPIYVGFYYDEQNKCLITKGTQNIYCFFPTKESFKTCFISHAPFLLTENRQNIKRDEELNIYLLKNLASLAVDSVLALRDYGIKHEQLLIDENIVDIIPQYELGYYDMEKAIFEEPMKEAFKEMVDSKYILLSRNGKYLPIKDAYTSTNAMLELLTQKQFVLLRKNSDYTDEEYISESVDFLKWELIMKLNKVDDENKYYCDINEYSIEDFGRDISAIFMQSQKTEWVTKFYTFLRSDAPKYWKITPQTRLTAHIFRDAPIVKIQSGEWVAPFIKTTTHNVFLPIENASNNNSSYNFISEEYLNEDMARKFFDELELKQPDEFDYIRNIVLKRYEEYEEEDIEIDDDILKTDFQLLLSYYQKVKDTAVESEYIGVLKDKLYLKGIGDSLYKASSLYIKSDFLRTFLGKKGLFFDLNYYKHNIREFKESLINDFLIKLGAKDKPTVERKKYNIQYGLPWHINTAVNKLDFYEFISVDDYYLSGFEYAHKNGLITKTVSAFLWNEILQYHMDKSKSRIMTRQKYKQYYDSHETDSTLY